MRIILPLLAATSLMLSACAGVEIGPGAAPTPCGTPTVRVASATEVGQSSNSTGGTGIAGGGTGLDLTVSPDMLATSEAAFAKANRTGPTEAISATPGPLLPPGSEQPLPNLPTGSATLSPTPTSTQYLSPNNGPGEGTATPAPMATSTQYLSPNNGPTPCGG